MWTVTPRAVYNFRKVIQISAFPTRCVSLSQQVIWHQSATNCPKMRVWSQLGLIRYSSLTNPDMFDNIRCNWAAPIQKVDIPDMKVR